MSKRKSQDRWEIEITVPNTVTRLKSLFSGSKRIQYLRVRRINDYCKVVYFALWGKRPGNSEVHFIRKRALSSVSGSRSSFESESSRHETLSSSVWARIRAEMGLKEEGW